MTESGGYPEGTEYNLNAPWNLKISPEQEIEVTISVTLSKTVKVKVSDYIVVDEGVDEEGLPYQDCDYSECDLKEVAEKQIKLPQDQFKDWNVDDFVVIQD